MPHLKTSRAPSAEHLTPELAKLSKLLARSLLLA